MPDRIPVRATRNGGLDFVEVPTRNEGLIAAYLEERRGYEIRGLPDRVQLVDQELARLGHKVDAAGGTDATATRSRNRRNKPHPA